MPRGIKPTDLSNLEIISKNLSEGTVKRNTQLTRNKSEICMSRHFTKNYRMLRYRIIRSTLFSDTIFATPKEKYTRGNTC